MPWSATDAPKHTRQASTPELRELWAKIANDQLAKHGDDARAIREANAAVAKRRVRSRSRFI